MTAKYILTDEIPAGEAEQLLADGALIVFGQRYLEAAQSFSEQIPHLKIIATESVEALELPDVRMRFCFLSFAHNISKRRRHPTTVDEVTEWRERLTHGMSFAEANEPHPKIDMAAGPTWLCARSKCAASWSNWRSATAATSAVGAGP